MWQLLPNLLVYFGTLGLIVTAFGLGPAVAAHDQNVELHRIGVRATAEVVSVRKQHHHSRHSSWDEWIPTTQQTVDGWSSTTELERYSSRDEDAFHRGQRFAVLVDPGDRDSVVPASNAARDRKTRVLHRSVGVAIGTVVFLGVGVPVVVHRRRHDPKLRRRREKAARQKARARATREKARRG
ncbi:hypothetical protein [Curtobacterium sp. MCBD17_030]|uniref:hypothetical protein n=1 Tax=Curtobacterium sp. MCBD17_030 TaxID=2175649 RepID=UPI000D95C9BC|nr:hypothetical protein [Curtobacterium sp. MCBD17_030]PYY31557.1 hypothetical protein DEI89_16750 [Curtobacterium sp. MCBD17_030]